MKFQKEYTEVLASGINDGTTFGMNVSSAAFDILSSTIYTHKIIAVIREYVSNAIDAHVSAGITHQPVDITLPTNINPSFIVRDFGFGLSEEDIYQTFIIYFKTTKETKMDEIGGLGLGAKSGFAYTDSFEVISIYNGLKSTYIMYIGADGIPTLNKVSSVSTEEHSGLTINIPVKEKDFHRFSDEASIILSMFKTKPNVKTVGFKFAHDDIYEQIESKGFATIPRSTWSSLYSGESAYLLVGGVLYPIPSECDIPSNLGKVSKGALVIPYDISDVRPTASREGIQVVGNIVSDIENRIKEISDTYFEDFIQDLSFSKNSSEALKKVYDEFGYRIAVYGMKYPKLFYKNKEIREIANKKIPIPLLCRRYDMKCETGVSQYTGYSSKNIKLSQKRLDIISTLGGNGLVVYYKEPDCEYIRYTNTVKKFHKQKYEVLTPYIIIKSDMKEGFKTRLEQYLGGNCKFIPYSNIAPLYDDTKSTKRLKKRPKIKNSRGAKSDNTIYCRYWDGRLGTTYHHELDDAHFYAHGSEMELPKNFDILEYQGKKVRIIISHSNNINKIKRMNIPHIVDVYKDIAKGLQEYNKYRELRSYFILNDNTLDSFKVEREFKVLYEVNPKFRRVINKRHKEFIKLHEKYCNFSISYCIMKYVPSPNYKTMSVILDEYRHLIKPATIKELIKLRMFIEEHQKGEK